MGGVGSRDRLCQTSPIPRSPGGDNKCNQPNMAMTTHALLRQLEGHSGEISVA